jgi:exopolysaccharide biosynthesis polyprenyl glycosylphosphotransferase
MEIRTDGDPKKDPAAAMTSDRRGEGGENSFGARADYQPPTVSKGTGLDSRTVLTRIWDTPAAPATAPVLRVGILKHIQAQGWMALDALLGAATMLAGLILTPYYRQWNVHYFHSSYKLLAILIFSISLIFSGLSTGLYDKTTSLSRWRIVMISLATCLLAMALTALVFALFLFQPIGRWIIIITLFLCFSGLTLPRLFFYNSLLMHKIKMMIVGESREVFSIYQALQTETAHSHYLVCALCPTDAALETPPGHPIIPVAEFLRQQPGQELGRLPDPTLAFCSLGRLKDCCERLEIEKIIVGDNFSKSLASFSHLMNCFPAGLRIMSWGSFNEEFLQHISIDSLSPEWFYSANLNVNNPFLFAVKRGFDLVISGLGLLLTLPITLPVSILIKLSSPGPVIYRQERTGRFGRPFRIYKFRTMVTDAENGDAQWAAEDDARCTPLGRWLRRSRLDELPQLWNILRGEMSVVGPRPERPELVERLAELIPFYDLRHLVSPGLTGCAQISYPYAASVRDAKVKLQYDLYYIKFLSLFLDLQIILRTFSVMMRGSR